MDDARSQLDAVDLLIQVSQSLSSSLNLDDTLYSVSNLVEKVLEAEATSIILYDMRENVLRFKVATGAEGAKVEGLSMGPAEGIAGWVFQHRKPIIVEDPYRNPRFFRQVDELSTFRTRSMIAVPLVSGNKALGVLEILNKRDGGHFTRADLRLAYGVANQAAVSIDNALLHHEIVQKERLASIGETMIGISHCVKNILTGINAGAYMVDYGLSSENREMTTKGWEILKRNNKRMLNLASDMLDFAKDYVPVIESVNLAELMEDIKAVTEENSQARSVALVSDIQEEVREFHFDPKGLYRLLLNLVVNAMDACETDGHGRVYVQARLFAGDKVRLRVLDNGSGIKREQLDQIFNVFFTTKGSKGSGLGLAISKKIVEEHGGTMRVISREGRGTMFVITFPLVTG